MLKAVLFDMDGVIIDSEPMHSRAALLAFKSYQHDLSMDYIESFIGSTTYHMCQKMIEDFQLSVTPEELLKEYNETKEHLLKEEGYTVVPYVIDLIKNLNSNHIKLSIASSSSVSEIEAVMDSLGLRRYFDGFVSGTSVAKPKPAPDIFLAAAKGLGVKPKECIIIEDSFNGVTAAESAGIPCIGFVNPHSGNQDLRKATMLIEGFDEIDYNFLNEVYEGFTSAATIFTTDLFIIRELSVSDIPSLFHICMQPSVREFIHDFSGDLQLEQEKHQAYIKNIYRYYGYGLWGVFLKESDKLIGRCGIELKMLGNEAVYELGYLLDKDYQGQGYATQYVKEVINYCFQVLGLPRIVALIDQNNLKSIRLAKRVGMYQTNEIVKDKSIYYVYEIMSQR